MIPSWHEQMAALDAQNRAEGKCTSCGGSGVVANLRAIERTGDPHINRRCFTCKGTGKLQGPREDAHQEEP